MSLQERTRKHFAQRGVGRSVAVVTLIFGAAPVHGNIIHEDFEADEVGSAPAGAFNISDPQNLPFLNFATQVIVADSESEFADPFGPDNQSLFIKDHTGSANAQIAFTEGASGEPDSIPVGQATMDLFLADPRLPDRTLPVHTDGFFYNNLQVVIGGEEPPLINVNSPSPTIWFDFLVADTGFFHIRDIWTGLTTTGAMPTDFINDVINRPFELTVEWDAGEGLYSLFIDGEPVLFKLTDGTTADLPMNGTVDGVNRLGYSTDASLTAEVWIDNINVASADVVPGDADGDGDVDAFDLGIWQTQFGETGESLSADFDGDGDVDAFDLGLWQTNFGTGVEGAAVPEPAGAVSFLLTVAGLAIRRRRRTG